MTNVHELIYQPLRSEQRPAPSDRMSHAISLDPLVELRNVLNNYMRLVGLRRLPTTYLNCYSARAQSRSVNAGVSSLAETNNTTYSCGTKYSILKYGT